MKNATLKITTRKTEKLKYVAFAMIDYNYEMNANFFADCDAIDTIIDAIVKKAIAWENIDIVFNSTDERPAGSISINYALIKNEYLLASFVDMIFRTLVFHGYCNNKK